MAVKITVLVNTTVGRPIHVAIVNGLNRNLYLVHSRANVSQYCSRNSCNDVPSPNPLSHPLPTGYIVSTYAAAIPHAGHAISFLFDSCSLLFVDHPDLAIYISASVDNTSATM